MWRVGQHRRKIIESLFELRPFRTFATDENLRSSLDGVRGLRLDFFSLHFGMHGAKPGVFVHSIADLQALNLSHKLLDKLIVNALDHIQPFHSKASLSTVLEPSDRGAAECLIDVRHFAENHS